MERGNLQSVPSLSLPPILVVYIALNTMVIYLHITHYLLLVQIVLQLLVVPKNIVGKVMRPLGDAQLTLIDDYPQMLL